VDHQEFENLKIQEAEEELKEKKKKRMVFKYRKK